MEDQISKLELGQDTVRPLLRQLQTQQYVPNSARNPSPHRVSITPMSGEQAKQVEQLKVMIDSQLKGNNRAVKLAVEEAKHATSLVKQEMQGLKDKIHT